MTDVIVPFVTGLTTGGLSCLAVQGGLLATSIAHQTETEIQQELVAKQAARSTRQPQDMPITVVPSVHRSAGKRHARHKHKHEHAHQAQVATATHLPAAQAPVQKAEASQIAALPAAAQKHAAMPILIFLGAKLVAYTILGALLGALGSVLQLTPAMRAIIQIAIGAFMVGTALNMLKVHPIFRFFAIEPPKAVTRYIRKVAKNSSDDVITPAFLGALTVFIPCGVTQTMMALAITSGDPLSGALIMFSFTLGSSPLFFALAYAARKLGERMEARFLKLAAILVLILGLVAVDSGLNLLGSPLSFSAMLDSTVSAVLAPSGRPASAANLATSDADNVATITVYPNSYQPNRIRAQAGKPARLKLVTNRTYGCTRAFTIPSLGIQEILPETGETVIDIPAQSVGSLRFSCGMGMYGGAIEFEYAGATGAVQAPVQQAPVQTSVEPQSNPTPPNTTCDPSIASCEPNQIDPNFIGPVQANQVASATASTQSDAATQTVTINVSDYGYEPPASRAKANVPIKLVLQTQGAYGCVRAFVIPILGIEEILPEQGTTTLDIPPQPAGTVGITCGMGTYRGQLVFE